MNSLFQVAGETEGEAPEPAEGAAVVFERAVIELGGAVVWRCFGLSGSIGFLRSASCALGGGSLWAFGLGGGGGASVASALSSFGKSGTFISCGCRGGGTSGLSSCAVCCGSVGAGSGLGGSGVATGVGGVRSGVSSTGVSVSGVGMG